MSPPNEDRPGHHKATGATTRDREDLKSSSPPYGTAAGLRRRRAAAQFLAPLPDLDGRRDPLDPVWPQRAARCELRIVVDRARDKALVSGWCDAEIVHGAGHTPRWSPSGAGWCIDAAHIDDVIAEADRHRRIVQLHDRPPQPVVVP